MSDDVPDDASVRAPVLADERRLLIAAMGQARRRLVVTAVDAGMGDAADHPAVAVLPRHRRAYHRCGHPGAGAGRRADRAVRTGRRRPVACRGLRTAGRCQR